MLEKSLMYYHGQPAELSRIYSLLMNYQYLETVYMLFHEKKTPNK